MNRSQQARYFTEATKTIDSVSPGHCLRALEMLQYKFAISSKGALYQEENALVPLPFQKRSIQPWKWLFNVFMYSLFYYNLHTMRGQRATWGEG